MNQDDSNHSDNNSASSVHSEDRLKIDPNYKWLLKDLNLNNDKRVIDVTALIENNLSKMNLTNEDDAAESEKKNIDTDTDTEISDEPEQLEHQQTDKTSKSNTSRSSSSNTSSKASEVEKMNENEADDTKNDYTSKILNQVSFFSNLDGDEIDNSKEKLQTEETVNEEEEVEDDDDDHKKDCNFISELYTKFVFNNLNKNSKNENNESCDSYDEQVASVTVANDNTNLSNEDNNEEDDKKLYKEWSEKFREQQTSDNSVNDENKSDAGDISKRNNKFSKSFEVNLDDLDNLINRVDNGIKLKRNNKLEAEQNETEKKSPAKVKENDAEQELKQKPEWLDLFVKLESEYKQKFEEQQKLNDLKLISMQEEIKKSILEQQEQIIKQQTSRPASNIDLKSTFTIESSDKSDKSDNEEIKKVISPRKEIKQPQTSSSALHSSSMNSINASICSQQSTQTVVDNAKYISNLRLELKTKHARHVQDLKDYYERELEDLRKRLMSKGGTSSSYEDEIRNDELAQINNELKSTNISLLNKLVSKLWIYINLN